MAEAIDEYVNNETNGDYLAAKKLRLIEIYTYYFLGGQGLGRLVGYRLTRDNGAFDANICDVIVKIRHQKLEKVIKNWSDNIHRVLGDQVQQPYELNNIPFLTGITQKRKNLEFRNGSNGIAAAIGIE